jgi:hypothetical protein
MPAAKHNISPAPYPAAMISAESSIKENDSLHRLSFLLTADRQKAEPCFVSGLKESVNGSPVFKEWARSWAVSMQSSKTSRFC